MLRNVCMESIERRRESEEEALRNVRIEGLSRFMAAMSQLRPDWAAQDPALSAKIKALLQATAFDVVPRAQEKIWIGVDG